MAQHLFGIDEVNSLIPKLELVMARLQQRGSELRHAIQALAQETGKSLDDLDTGAIVALRPVLRPVIEEIERLVTEIEACGGQFKGLDLGLVDFPAEINGEVALLCWQFGEKEVGFWHSIERGFEGRQPLPAHQPGLRYLQ